MANKRLIGSIGAGVVIVALGFGAYLQLPEAPEPVEDDLAVSPSSTPAAEPVTTLAAPPFVYRIGLLAAPTTLNYWGYLGAEPTAWNTYVLASTKPALYTGDPVAMTLVPELAAGEPTQPEESSGAWTVEVGIAEGFEWSDGAPITAEDLEFTFDTVRHLGLGGGWADAFPSQVVDVAALGAHRVRISFDGRPGMRVWPYGVGMAPLMPAHVWESRVQSVGSAEALYALDPSGDVFGGPLAITTAEGSRIRAVTNPGYPDAGAVDVEYRIFDDEAAAVAAVATRSIDTILSPGGLSTQGASALDGADGVTVTRNPANSVRYLGFNLDRDPMSAPGFRQALGLLIDRSELVPTLTPGADPAYTMMAPGNTRWFDPSAAGEIATRFDGEAAERLGEAVALLEAAGYAWASKPSAGPDGLQPGSGLEIGGQAPAPITILTSGDEYDPERPDYAARIEEVLDGLGFDARPVVTDFDTVVDLAFSPGDDGARGYDMYLLGWTLGNPLLPDFYGRLFGQGSPSNSTGYRSEEFDRELALYDSSPDLPSARQALWQMEKTLASDLPYLVLYHPEVAEAYRSDRVGYRQGPWLGGLQARLGAVDEVMPAGDAR